MYREAREPDLIETQRLMLRRPTIDDLPAANEMHLDPRTNVYYAQIRTAETIRVDLGKWVAKWESHGLGYWVIEHNAEAIGFGGLSQIIEGREEVLNLYYRFRPSAWGQGFAYEMSSAAIDYANRALPEIPVSIVTDHHNAPSLRLAKRLGFTEYGRKIHDGTQDIIFRRP